MTIKTKKNIFKFQVTQQSISSGTNWKGPSQRSNQSAFLKHQKCGTVSLSSLAFNLLPPQPGTVKGKNRIDISIFIFNC